MPVAEHELDYAADCELGRAAANDLMRKMAETGCPAALPHAVRALLEAEKDDPGVLIGYLTTIAEFAIAGYHAGEEMR